MPLRSGKEKRTELPPKRSYNRRASIKPASTEPASIEPVSVLVSTPNVSFNTVLQLSNSTINESIDYSVTLDSYDRIIKKSDKKEKKQITKRRFVPLDEKFKSLAAVDQYIRLNNQFGMNIKNNNQIKCTLNDCDEAERHEMTQMYLKCSCKQNQCNLWYSYRNCKNVNKWYVAVSGQHPTIVDVEVKKLGIAVQVRELINEIVDVSPDIKPKDILLTIQKRRKKNQILDRENKIKQIKDSNYVIEKHPNPNYLFHKDLLPTLRQIQSYILNSANQRHANRIEKIKQLIIKHQFDEELADDDPFFFNITFDKEGEIVLGDGSETHHLNIIMTSKRLMTYISKKGVGHSDGTYKISAHGYVLVIYGISDIRGTFHPIAFMISSHEQEEDFHYLFSSLKNLAITLKLNFDPKYLMQDACLACYNATSKIFPKADVLMCYYHVRANIKKHKNLLLDASQYSDFMKAIKDIHYSTSEIEYEQRLADFENDWSEAEPEMYKYVRDQWLEGVFINWQIFRNEPGYANTNSNIESFNASFKRDYTKRSKLSIISVCNKIFECINEYSISPENVFHLEPRYIPEVKQKAFLISSKCFIKTGKSKKKIIYKGESSSEYTIRLDDEKCFKCCSCITCCFFIKWAICKHVVAYSNINKLDLYGYKYRQPDNFVRKMKKGAPGRNAKAKKALVYD